MGSASTRGSRKLALASAVLLVLVAGHSRAESAETWRQGSLSVGALGSYEILRLKDLNTQIDIYNSVNGTRLNDLYDGLGGLAEVRYAFWRKVCLGAEVGYFKGTSDDPVKGERIEVSGVPFAFTVGWIVHEERRLAVRFVAGLGYLFDGTFHLISENGGTASESDFLFQIGGELEWRPAAALGVSLQALARQANVQRPSGFATELDFSGGTVRVGLRGYWGGRDE